MVEKEGESIDSVLEQFLAFVGNLRLVSFNAPFDYGFLSKSLSSLDKEINNPISCALDMARRAWPGLKSYRLKDICSIAGFNTEECHRALKDCELTVIVYCAAAKKLGRIE
jgi:DNA polymerase III epsilon subunit-like protein